MPAVVADAQGYLDLIAAGEAGWSFAAGDPQSLGQALDAAAADAYEFAAKRDAALSAASRSFLARGGPPDRSADREARGVKRQRPVLLVASSGGHLLQLLALREAWHGLPTIWVSNDKEDARSLLAAERAHFLPGPYSRNFRSLLANLLLAVRVVGARAAGDGADDRRGHRGPVRLGRPTLRREGRLRRELHAHRDASRSAAG